MKILLLPFIIFVALAVVGLIALIVGIVRKQRSQIILGALCLFPFVISLLASLLLG